MQTADIIIAEFRNVNECARRYNLALDKYIDFGGTLTGGKPIKYESDGVKYEKNGNAVERAYCKLADYSRDVDAALNEYLTARENAENLIARIDNQQTAEILTRYYIMGEKMELIAAKMHYSERRVRQLHDLGMATLNGINQS